jgi:opacity protein-like surface antigen
VKKLLITTITALAFTGAAHAADSDDGVQHIRFQPWQMVWQCNDIRVTVTARDPFSIEYDLGGMIWGGSRFTVVKGQLFFNERPCLNIAVWP